MGTARQTELIDALLSQLHDEEKALCEPLIRYLLELGYTPKKHKKSTFAVEFEKNGRIIAKMETTGHGRLLVWLRFSASDTYSKVFHDAVKRRPEAWIKRNQEWVEHDVKNCCGLCKGWPRLYHHINDDGSRINRCGGYTIMIQGLAFADVPEALRLIKEQDEYFTELLA